MQHMGKKIINFWGCRFSTVQFVSMVFLYLAMEDMFSWLLFPEIAFLTYYKKIVTILVFVFLLYQVTDLKKNEQLYVVLFCAFIAISVFQSLYFYNSLFEYFTIYTALVPIILVVFSKYFFRKLDLNVLEFIANFYVLTYLVFMVVYGSEFSFSLRYFTIDSFGAFSGDTRIIHARSILMLVIPFLWYLNKYLLTRRVWFLCLSVGCLIVLIIHQHRSVWTATILSLTVFLLIRVKTPTKRRFHGDVLLKLLYLGGLIGFFAILALSFVFPEKLIAFGERFAEIFNPVKKNTTGNWRVEQVTFYMKYVFQKPFLGWTFLGFDLPVSSNGFWEENTGHHFHNGYLKILFYHGVLGLFLIYSPLFTIFRKVLKRGLSDEVIVLSSFCLGGLVFSFSYVLPTMFWGHVGLCLYYLSMSRESLLGNVTKSRPEMVSKG